MSFSIESETYYSVEGREHSCFNMAFHSCGIAGRRLSNTVENYSSFILNIFLRKNWESQQSVSFVVKKVEEFYHADFIPAREKKTDDLFTLIN